MTTEIAIALPPKDQAIQVYSAEQGLDPYLAQIKAEIDAFVPDTGTKKGRDAIASMAHKVARSKTALDNLGKDLVADLKDLPKKIDAERKRMRDLLDAWKDDVRAPLTAWEQAEADRVSRHNQNVAWFSDRVEAFQHSDSIQVRAAIADVAAVVVDEKFEEFESQAHRAKEQAITDLTALAESKEKAEAEAAELARLRAEAAAREQADREAKLQAEAAAKAKAEAEASAERERQAAEAKAKAEREAAERRELELKLQAETAERQKVEAEARAKQAQEEAQAKAAAAVERERQRAKEQAEHEAAEADARAKDKEHRQKINRAALDALEKGGIDAETAKTVITLIAKGAVPNVSIRY